MATPRKPPRATPSRRPLATPEEVSEYLQIPVDTLKDWRYRGGGPKWRPAGRHPRYDWDDVDEWWRAQDKHPRARATGEQGAA